MSKYTIRSDAEILEKFRISEGRWVVLCFHNPSYGVGNMDEDGFCTFGTFLSSLEMATKEYQERVCALLDAGLDLAVAFAGGSGTLSSI